MEATRRRHSDAIQASREDGSGTAVLHHYVAMITGPAVPRGIDLSEV
jgi:hypothetical protein